MLHLNQKQGGYMQYKVIPCPMVFSGESYEAASQLEKLINSNTRDGWRYHSMETLTTSTYTKGGCMQPQQEVRTVYYMLIFEKESESDFQELKLNETKEESYDD